jgi:ketosteroid isomerase-like protein
MSADLASLAADLPYFTRPPAQVGVHAGRRSDPEASCEPESTLGRINPYGGLRDSDRKPAQREGKLMRLFYSSLTAILLSIVATGRALSQGPATASGDSGLQAFLHQWEKAQSRFINGDPTLWKQNASHRDDATIFGAFGGHEKGWKQVGPRNDWASSKFKDSGAKQTIEYLNSAASGDLAFTISLERQEQVSMGNQDKPAPRTLRVTQIFRKEDGVWKLLHRHADPLVERRAPSKAP